MKIMSLSLLIISLLFTGCSTKYEHPVELDDSSFVLIHSNLLTKHKMNVPRDLSMTKRNWKYRLKLKKEGGYLVKNHQIIKTFYLVDHADYILIEGNKLLAREYKHYFIKNGSKAYISIKPKRTNSNTVTLTLSHTKQYLKEKK
jgi:hypothetical protein